MIDKMLNKIKPYIKEKFISETKHPEADLWIYNYSPKAQYEQKWDDIIIMCRGLILDKEGNIVARPFKKFFNLAEHLQKDKPIPKGKIKITEKFDGSLGILYEINGEYRIATRGSFTSEQALKGTEILQTKYQGIPFEKELTYLFEIIYPQNRIVLDYGDREDLVLLAIFDTYTGKELSIDEFRYSSFPKPKIYDGITDLAELEKLDDTNKEGFVIAFENGLRLKVKFEEYVRLHRLVTETNSKRIWEYLKDNQPIDELLDRVPDEFYDWVKKTIADIKEHYAEIEYQAKLKFKLIDDYKDRKSFAEKAKKYPERAILFRMLDQRPYSEVIWKMVKPKAESPFKKEI